MPTGEPVQDTIARFDLLVESTVYTTSTVITLTATSGWQEDAAIAEAVIQDLVDLVASSTKFRLTSGGAVMTTTAGAPITPTPTPPGGE